MRYPIFIEPAGDGTAYGIVVPDLPGCFSAGSTLDEALANARMAVAAWIESMRDAGKSIPQPTRLDDWLTSYRDWIPSTVEIEPTATSRTTSRYPRTP